MTVTNEGLLQGFPTKNGRILEKGHCYPGKGAIHLTLQETNISHLGKRKIILKTPLVGDMLVPWRVYSMYIVGTYPLFPGLLGCCWLGTSTVPPKWRRMPPSCFPGDRGMGALDLNTLGPMGDDLPTWMSQEVRING